MDLMDKIINLKLNTPGTSAFIYTPPTGRKQKISISGEIVSSDLVPKYDLKLTNFYSLLPLNQYKTIEVTMGYKNSIQTSFTGQVMIAYTDNPPPDKVTTFELMCGQYDNWINKTINVSYDKGVTLSTILQELCGKLGLQLIINTEVVYPMAVSFNGLIKDFITKLKNSAHNLVIRPDGINLVCYDKLVGTNVVHNIDKIISAIKDASGFHITIPFDPSIRCGDTLFINPVYFKMSLGAETSTSNVFTVVSGSFEFETVGDTNSMSLVCVTYGTDGSV